MASTLAHIALALLTALSWLGAGDLALRRIGPAQDRMLHLLNRIGVGAIAFALATFAAGLAGMLHAWLYMPVAVGAAAWGAASLRLELRGRRIPTLRGWPAWQLALVALVAVYVLVDIAATAAPISSADALAYHAAAPAVFERTHEIREISWNWAAYQPFTVEMLMLDGFLLWDYVQGAFAPLLLALGALAAVTGAANRLGGRTVALLAATIYFAQPFMTWAATSTFVEPALAFVLALAAWNLVSYLNRGGTAALALTGVFAGAGAGIKYVGVATAAALVLAGLALTRARLDRRAALAFTIPALLVGLPWYVKNAIQTGDPVYPLLAGGPNPEAEFSRDAILKGYGAGHGPLDLLLLPFRLLAEGDRFDRGDFISPLFVMFAPLALLDRRARRVAAVVLAAAAVYVVAWFAASQQARFLLPLMAPLAVLAALGLVALAKRGRLARGVTVAVTALALCASLGGTAVFASQFAGVVVGTESAAAFLRQKAAYYEGAVWVNDHLPADARVLYGPGSSLYVERDLVNWSLDALPLGADRAETLRFFAATRPTHAAVLATDKQRLRQLRWVGAVRIGEVGVHQVFSRTRNEVGPEERMLVFAIRPV